MKLFNRILKNVVSDEDRFIHRFDVEHQDKQSFSQQAEIAKHEQIARLRDQAVSKKEVTHSVWQDF